ncbi:MAG: YbaY family lipoprotein [Rhizobiaceae bacterium]
MAYHFRILVLVLGAALALSPAFAADDCKDVSGEIVSQAQVTLPADANVTVRLIEAGIPEGPLLVIGETRFAAGGKALPLAFTFHPVCDDLWLAVRAGFEIVIESGGKTIFSTDPVQLMDQREPYHPVEVFASK